MFIRFLKYFKYKFFFKKQIYKKIKENSISYIDFEYDTSYIRFR